MTISVTSATNDIASKAMNTAYDVIQATGFATHPGDLIYVYAKDNFPGSKYVLLGETLAAPKLGPFSYDAGNYVLTTLAPFGRYSSSQIVAYDASSNMLLSPTVSVTPEGGTISNIGNVAVGFQVINQINVVGGTGNVAVAVQLNNQVNIAVSSPGAIQGGAQTNINNAGNLVIGVAGSAASLGAIGGTRSIEHTGASGQLGTTKRVGAAEHIGTVDGIHPALQSTIARVSQSTIGSSGHKPAFFAQPAAPKDGAGDANHHGQVIASLPSAANPFLNPKTMAPSAATNAGQSAHHTGPIMPDATQHSAAVRIFPSHGADSHTITLLHTLH